MLEKKNLELLRVMRDLSTGVGHLDGVSMMGEGVFDTFLVFVLIRLLQSQVDEQRRIGQSVVVLRFLEVSVTPLGIEQLFHFCH